MSEYECGACGRSIAVGGCACGATWPSARRGLAWLLGGVLLLPVSTGSAYGGWILARRTVLERPHLGLEATATGAALVGAAALLALAAPAALARGWGLLGRRGRARVPASPPRWHLIAGVVDGGGSRLAALAARVPAALALGVVTVGVALWVVAFLAPAALPRAAFVAVTIAAWTAVPVGVVVDGHRAVATRRVAALSLVPFLAALVGAWYLIVRLLDW